MDSTLRDDFWKQLVEEKLSGLSIQALPPTLKLPALPLAVTQFLERSRQPNTTLKELSRIIETDSGLTLELLRFVNSSFVGLRHKATSVTHALTLLGQRRQLHFWLPLEWKQPSGRENRN